MYVKAGPYTRLRLKLAAVPTKDALSFLKWIFLITLSRIYLYPLHSRRSYHCAGDFVAMQLVRPHDSTPCWIPMSLPMR